MSELIVIGFDNPVQARAAYDEALALQSDFIAELRGVAVVTVDAEGKTHVETPQKIVGMGAAYGRTMGDVDRPVVLRAVLRGRPGRRNGRAVRQTRQIRDQ